MMPWWWAVSAFADCGAVAGAEVHLPGSVAVADVVWVDGRIVAVGPKLPGLARAGTWNGSPCAVVDGSKRHVTAGFVAAPTQLGVIGIDLESATHEDDAELGDDPIRATLVVTDGYDPTSAAIPVQRIQGLTSAVVFPGGGTVAGVAGFVVLAGDTQADAVVDRDVAVVGGIPTGAWGEGLAVWSGLLDDARNHARNPAAFDQGRPYAHGASRADLEVLGRVVRRELPLVLGAQSAWQIEALLRWKATEQIDLVIDGAAEGWRVAPALAAARVPVVVDPLLYGAGGFDQLAARPDNAALLAAAGVEVILSTHSTHNARTLRQVAGNAVRGGMDHEAALRSITAVPARVFGQAGRGSILVGSAADLVVWTADPLELSTRAEHVFVGGREVSLRSRQTALFEKYRTLPGTPVAPLSLP
jgi:imidazolonepropionase-like amidohydrolase